MEGKKKFFIRYANIFKFDIQWLQLSREGQVRAG
jgi:hypothetical protein